MKILVDENIPLITVRTLQAWGHDVRDIRGTNNEGMDDRLLWQIAQDENRLLITTDKGFTQYRTTTHSGIIIVRLRYPNRHNIHQRIIYAINQFSEQEWHNLLVVMRDTAQSVWKVDGKSG